MMLDLESLVKVGADLVKSYLPPAQTEAEKKDQDYKLKALEIDLEHRLNEQLIKQENERTLRHTSDMKSDSWLSKNIRPLVLVYLMIAWTVFAFMSAYGLGIDVAYVEMLSDMLMAAFGFYFVSRGIEKVTSILK